MSQVCLSLLDIRGGGPSGTASFLSSLYSWETGLTVLRLQEPKACEPPGPTLRATAALVGFLSGARVSLGALGGVGHGPGTC